MTAGGFGLDVASWNVWGRFGDYRNRLHLIEKALKQLNPDIVCLQECWMDADGESLLTHLASALEFDHTFFASRMKKDRIGNAILSRYPITWVREVSLPGDPHGDLLGNVVVSLIAIDGLQVPVYTTHLDYRRWNSALRRQQLAAVLREVASVEGSAAPAIICGDFNAMPDSDEIRAIRGAAPPILGDLVFMDAWDYSTSGTIGTTWCIENPHTDSSFHGNARLDYIFLRYTPNEHRAVIESVETFGGALDGWPSDHLGVKARLRFATP